MIYSHIRRMCPELWAEPVGIRRPAARPGLSEPPSLWRRARDWAGLLWVLLPGAQPRAGEGLLLDSWHKTQTSAPGWDERRDTRIHFYASLKCFWGEYIVQIVRGRKEILFLRSTISCSLHIKKVLLQGSQSCAYDIFINMRCPVRSGSLWWAAVIYYVWCVLPPQWMISYIDQNQT